MTNLAFNPSPVDRAMISKTLNTVLKLWPKDPENPENWEEPNVRNDVACLRNKILAGATELTHDEAVDLVGSYNLLSRVFVDALNAKPDNLGVVIDSFQFADHAKNLMPFFVSIPGIGVTIIEIPLDDSGEDHLYN